MIRMFSSGTHRIYAAKNDNEHKFGSQRTKPVLDQSTEGSLTNKIKFWDYTPPRLFVCLLASECVRVSSTISASNPL